MSTMLRFILVLFVLVLGACDRQPSLKPLQSGSVILAVGDSLTYGTGVAQSASYPARLQASIRYTVVNAGVPGETSEEALARLPGLLDQYHPQLVILCTGGNDMLRKLDASATQSHIHKMINLIRSRNAQLILIGVPTPTLFGGTPEFYKAMAVEFSIPYEGEILNRILKDRDLKSDTVHPNEQGYQLLANRIAELLNQTGAIK